MTIFRHLLFGLIIILSLANCRKSVTNGIINKVEKDCSNPATSECRITFKDLTNFKWDRMYLFGSWTEVDSITDVLGFKYTGNDVPDDNTRMLFTYKNEVVYEEDFESLDYNNSTIAFNPSTDTLFYSKPYYLMPQQAVFKVQKYKDNDHCKTCFDYNLLHIKK